MPGASTAGARWQRAELRAKEQALRDKDAVIASLQEEVQRMQQTTRSANWPRFLPLVYLNIDGEVRDGVRRRHVKQMYYYWMCTSPATHAGGYLQPLLTRPRRA